MGNQLAPPQKFEQDHLADVPFLVFKEHLGESCEVWSQAKTVMWWYDQAFWKVRGQPDDKARNFHSEVWRRIKSPQGVNTRKAFFAVSRVQFTVWNQSMGQLTMRSLCWLTSMAVSPRITYWCVQNLYFMHNAVLSTGGSRLLKTVLCCHDRGGQVVVKVSKFFQALHHCITKIRICFSYESWLLKILTLPALLCDLSLHFPGLTPSLHSHAQTKIPTLVAERKTIPDKYSR